MYQEDNTNTITTEENNTTSDKNEATVSDDKKKNRKDTTIKNYKIIYSAFFKYGLIILIIAIAVFVFFLAIKNEKILNIKNNNEPKQNLLIQNYDKEISNINSIEKSNTGLNVKIRQGTLKTDENMIISYDNLILFKGFTLPRGIFMYADSIEDREYFDDPNYDIEQLTKFINNTIFVNYDEIISEKIKDPEFIELDENNVEKTFFLGCANRPRLLNGICDKYIEKFLNGFFVYKIDNDFPGFTKTIKNLIIKRKYKDSVCKGLDNYVRYSDSAPRELEDIAILCGGDILDDFYMIQDFVKTKTELENQYITSSTSKYKKMNEYKLISYQQILYNNLKKGIPPSEGIYKSYTNYLSNILKKYNLNPIDPIYYDITYRFNNLYVIPFLNKVKYQSTQTKREEIATIINDLEKLNNGDKIDGYVGIKSVLTNKSLEEDVSKIGINFISERDDIMSVLLKSLQSLNYLKIINDEIIGDTIRINGYVQLAYSKSGNATTPVPFGSTLINKNGKLIVKDFSLNLYGFDVFEINDVLEAMLTKRDYNIGEIYEFVRSNIVLYNTNDYSATPCDLLENRFKTLDIPGLNILICNDEKINITKGNSGDKILYQFKMNQYNIKSITTTDNDIQEYINEHYSGVTTDAMTINSTISEIIAYEPQKQDKSDLLEGNNNAIIAIDDLKTYLGVTVTDIGERNGKVAAEFSVSNIEFIGIYDTDTKKLGPIFLKEPGEEKGDVIINNFSIYLTSENQYEINKFLVEPIGYIYNLDKGVVTKYLPDLLSDYLSSKLGIKN